MASLATLHAPEPRPVKQPAANTLIGSIVVTPPKPRPAESVRVEVRSPNGAVLEGPNVRVMINGVPGAVRYLQFGRPGQRQLKVFAMSGDVAERQTHAVDVRGEPMRYRMARSLEQASMLLTQQVPGQPHEVTLGLGMLPAGGRHDARERRGLEASKPGANAALHTDAATDKERDAQEPAFETSYEWDFGDGTSAVTASPTVNHDYYDAIDHVRGHGSFHVRCRARHSSQETIRTLTVYSAYTACRKLGAVVPRVRGDTFAAKRYTMLSGTFRVKNVEDVALTLDRLSLAPLSEDPNALTMPGRAVKLGKPIEIAPRSTSVICVNVPIATGKPSAGELRHDVAGFSVLYLGQAGRLPVRVAATFEVRAGVRGKRPVRPAFANANSDSAWPWGKVVRALDARLVAGGKSVVPRSAVVIDAATGTVAVSLAQVKSGAGPAEIRASVDRIFGTVFEPAADDQPAAAHGGVATQRVLGRQLDGPPEPGSVAAGQVCDPENLSDEERDRAKDGQLVCQRTDETIEVLMPARFMNARKGDVILSPGGPGLIGGLLRGTDPPQLYSHSGIMTRNYDEVTHSTASEERMLDHKRGIGKTASNGFEPDALKYMWPGVVAQKIEAAVDGEPFTDPETGLTYSIYSFEAAVTGLTIDDEMVIVPPLVVKPDPMKETEAVRTALHAAATEARAGAGRPGVNSKSHYRLYCYTDPTIGETERAPSSAGWAAGTFGSVCSSYIWLMHRRAKAHFEAGTTHPLPTDLEPADVNAGASVEPGKLDGLYAYTAAERLAVAEWLFDTIHHEARDEAGMFNLFTDAADDLANQMINTFANDDADAKNSRKWRDMEAATAISPDNILFWDGPDGNGLYGYAEPLMYREPRKETYTVSRWKKVIASGRLSGKVTDAEGQPVAGALVQVYDGKSDYTDSGGRYELKDVPFGKYEVDSSKVIDGSLHSAQVSIDLQTADRVVDVRLAPPAAAYRRAQIHLNFWGIDGDGLGKDDILNPGPEYWELELGPDRAANDLERTYKWGGECRMEYVIECRLLVGNVLDVEVKGWLFEGTKESTDKEVGYRSISFTVDPEETGARELNVPTTDWAKKDEGRLTLTVKNALNTN